MYNFTILAVSFLYCIYSAWCIYVYYEKNKKKYFTKIQKQIFILLLNSEKRRNALKCTDNCRNTVRMRDTFLVSGAASIIPRNTRIYTVICLNAPRSGYAGGMRKKKLTTNGGISDTQIHRRCRCAITERGVKCVIPLYIKKIHRCRWGTRVTLVWQIFS